MLGRYLTNYCLRASESGRGYEDPWDGELMVFDIKAPPSAVTTVSLATP